MGYRRKRRRQLALFIDYFKDILSRLKKSNQMQQYVDIYLLQSHSTCFGCHSTHHQEYYKLLSQPPVQVIISVQPLTSNVACVK